VFGSVTKVHITLAERITYKRTKKTCTQHITG